MQKFFIEKLPQGAQTYLMSGDNFDHLRVLRPKIGESIVLCDGAGTDYFCSVRELSKQNAVLMIDAVRPSIGEPSVECHLFTALPKSDKLEHVIQKATELGACSITAFMSGRSVSRPDDKTMKSKLTRWQKIAETAASQCGRGIIPQVRFLPSFGEAVSQALQYELPLFLYENEDKRSLRQALCTSQFASVSVLSGPEGGFSDSEASLAVSSGLVSCLMGQRILRCETAPLCALSAIMYHSGNL